MQTLDAFAGTALEAEAKQLRDLFASGNFETEEGTCKISAIGAKVGVLQSTHTREAGRF